MPWASPHAGFLESDWLSTTQVEKTGISNRIQIFLSWKRKKKTVCHWSTCRCLQNWCLRKWILFFRMLKWRVYAGSRMCMAEREKKKKKVFLATLHGYCLQPFLFTASADHKDSGYFWQTTNTSKDGQKERNSLLLWSGIHSFILAPSAPWTHDCWTTFAPHVWSSCLTPTVLSYNRIY